MKRLHPPGPVLEIAQRLEDAGFEAWCVGGAIRDALLGHPHLDWDLATSATPTQVRDLFGSRLTIPIGIDFGTVGVLDRQERMHEVTTFRRDVRTDGRHAEVEFGASLDEDLARRDFTINAIAYSSSRRELRDPFGGQEDLARRVVKAVGDPRARMTEDRLRALRAIRFAARFDFAIDSDTLAAVEEAAPFLGRLSPERVKQEIEKTMDQVRCPSVALRLWRSTGAFRTLIPQLAEASNETLSIVDFLAQPGARTRPARRSNRLAGMLVGLSARDATAVLQTLRCSRAEIQWVGTLVDRWHVYGGEIERSLTSGDTRDAEIRRWVAGIGRTHIGGFMRLANAIWTSQRAYSDGQPPTASSIRRLYRRMLRSALRDVIDLGGLAIDGDDLRRSGIPPGPALGKILQALLVAVIEDPALNTPERLLDEGRRLAQVSKG